VEEAVREPRVPEVRELRQLREENQKLKQLVADLTLYKEILREAPWEKDSEAGGVAGGGGTRPHGLRVQRGLCLPRPGYGALEGEPSVAGARGETPARRRRSDALA
jgi:hypothetical protein